MSIMRELLEMRRYIDERIAAQGASVDTTDWRLARLADDGAWTPVWLTEANAAIRARFPSGYTTTPSYVSGSSTALQRVTLIGSMYWPAMIAREDLSVAQTESLYHWRNQAFFAAGFNSARPTRLAYMFAGGDEATPLGEIKIAVHHGHADEANLRESVANRYAELYP